MKIIDKKEMQKSLPKNKQTKKKRRKKARGREGRGRGGTEAIVKRWELNDFVTHLS